MPNASTKSSVLKTFVSLLSLLVLAMPVLAQQNAPQSGNPLDLRIIVDISGSMADTDPDNLRVPAVNLLLEMLPEGSTAGVWTFGQYVNMLVPHGEVNDAWRAQARERATQINSIALYTNIGEALERASYDFSYSTGRNEKHYIVLTDGVVDIPPNDAASRRERDRILNVLAPRIAEYNGTIHSIGLSDDIDTVLMSQLAAQTGGLNETASNAEELLAIFVQILNSSMGMEAPDEVSIASDQTFRVDASVSEFTALIFRGSDAALAFQTPDGQRYTVDNRPTSSRWLATPQFDLVTFRTPPAGTWRIDGTLGEDSRVTVVSDLSLRVDDIPRSVPGNTTLPLRTYFQDRNGRVTDSAFLDLIEVSATVRSGMDVVQSRTLTRQGDGFVGDLPLPATTGSYDIIIEANGQTFNRRRVVSFNVREPVAVEVIPQDTTYELRIYPNLGDLDSASVRVMGQVDGPDGSARFLPFVPQTAGYWSLQVAADRGQGNYVVEASIETSDANSILGELAIDPFVLRFPVVAGDAIRIGAQRTEPAAPAMPEPQPQPTMAEVPSAPTPAPEPVPEPEPMPEPEPVVEQPALVEPPESMPEPLPELDFLEQPAPAQSGSNVRDWLPYALAAGSGLLVLVLLYLAYRKFESRNQVDELDLDEPLTKAEKAVLQELDGKEVDEEIYVDPPKPAEAPPAAEPEMDGDAVEDDGDIPTISDAVQKAAEEPSVLDEEFDLESLGIRDSGTDEVLESVDDLDDWEDIISDDDSAFDEKLAPDEFDLSDDDIDDMLDDSLMGDELPEDEPKKP
ncbi:VWA domain-containing protein [Salinispirillum marinum]|uniref:VWA domain-containing protein n=2 Tax=Saccharospirillaceae TaxID=255527 RepID=A0ABV8BEM4_9GAMM